MDDHPLAGKETAWEAVVDDMEATAEAYREEGWETTELHPGDVLPLTGVDIGIDAGEEFDDGQGDTTQTAADDGWSGLDVLLPGNEFTAVESVVETSRFDESEVLRTQEDGVVLAVVVMKAAAQKQAVFVPLYYDIADIAGVANAARSAGRLELALRPLSNDQRVLFALDDPELLLPE
ncbi:hypothetical protein AUR64_13170 [Haloprofundus marisrubri]|uniref:Uncharacterized protein n=1 Tax=Haloprofundus marisrubri TaxID=1514971 RepID=A0A0W1R7A1_9EURY|nr:hypothetical protein [Haloprofundus marisrubri]KTG08773.1 hypothetical protein AUR64_13170 [Haloprofundus marisrubri]